MKIQKLTELFWVSDQLMVEDLEELSCLGVARVICNSPDCIDKCSPSFEVIADACHLWGVRVRRVSLQQSRSS